MATQFNPEQLKAHLAKLDDYEIERRIERKMWEGERLKVAQKILKERYRTRNRANQTRQFLLELAAILGALIISLGLALYAIRDRIFWHKTAPAAPRLDLISTMSTPLKASRNFALLCIISFGLWDFWARATRLCGQARGRHHSQVEACQRLHSGSPLGARLFPPPALGRANLKQAERVSLWPLSLGDELHSNSRTNIF